MNKARETLDKNFSLLALRFLSIVLSIVGRFPEAYSRACIRDNTTSMNMVISNTPGPQSPIFFCDKEVYDMGGVGPNVGTTGITMLISSYCGQVKLQLLADKSLNMDATVFMKHLEQQLDESIQKYAKQE